MAVDYRKLCIEIFGTDDENEIRRKASAVKSTAREEKRNLPKMILPNFATCTAAV